MANRTLLSYRMVGMATFEVPVTPHELWAVTTAFDTDNSGQVSEASKDGSSVPTRCF